MNGASKTQSLMVYQVLKEFLEKYFEIHLF